jgi:hypothetical protein
VTVNPPTLSVPQGGNGSVSASLTRGGGFSGGVTLAIAGLPAGVTPTITPTQLSGTTASATIDVVVAATVTQGTYTATITATAQGVGQATTTFQLTVTAAPTFALTAAPATLTIAPGRNDSTTVNIDRTNFTGDVALALVTPPAGITGTFNPTPATTNTSKLVVSVAANVAAGNYPLTIQGTATGPGARTATLTVTVTAASASNVEYQFCDASEVPAFFAYQDGNGAWQAVTGSTSGNVTRFAFNITQGRGGVLTVFQIPSSMRGNKRSRDKLRERFSIADDIPFRSSMADAYHTYVFYGSTAELAQDGLDACTQTESTKTVTATVGGVPAGAFGIVSLGNSTDVFTGGVSTNPVTFTDVPDGLVDFVGTRMQTPGTPPDKVIVFRNLNVPDGGALPSPVNFDGPAATTPATANVAVTGSAGHELEVFTTLVTANSHVLFWFDLAPSPVTTRPWAGLAQTAMLSGDLHSIVVFASPAGSSDFRVAGKYVTAVSNQTVAFAPTLAAPTTSLVVGGAYPRFRFLGTLPTEYNKTVTIDVVPTALGNSFSILATGAYLTASAIVGYDFTMPDVAGLAGFPAGARLTAGGNELTLSGLGFNGPGVYDLEPSVGAEFRSSLIRTNLVVP